MWTLALLVPLSLVRCDDDSGGGDADVHADGEVEAGPDADADADADAQADWDEDVATCDPVECASGCVSAGYSGGSCVPDGCVCSTCAEGYRDPATSLCWQDPPADDTFDWADAVAYCHDLSLAGHGPGSWYLPTVSDLRSLVRGCPATETRGACAVTDGCREDVCWNDACVGCPLNGGPGAGGAYWPTDLEGVALWYWSSSSDAGGTSNAWGVYFGFGYVNSGDKTSTLYVRCVRRGS